MVSKPCLPALVLNTQYLDIAHVICLECLAIELCCYAHLVGSLKDVIAWDQVQRFA